MSVSHKIVKKYSSQKLRMKKIQNLRDLKTGMNYQAPQIEELIHNLHLKNYICASNEVHT